MKKNKQNQPVKKTLFSRAAMTLLLCVLTTATAWAQTPTNIGSIQWNSSLNAYEINSVDNLNDLAVYVNGYGGFESVWDEYYQEYVREWVWDSEPHSCGDMTFKMTVDIDFKPGPNETNNFTPIGRDTYEIQEDCRFFGTFDGQGHTISGLRITTQSSEQGLFSKSQGTITNLTLADAQITGTHNIGGIVGTNFGTVSNCHVASDVFIRNAMYNYVIMSHGGIAGSNWNGTVTHCTSAATLTLDNNTNCIQFGAIVGYNQCATLTDNIAIGATVPAVIDNSHGAIYGQDYSSNPASYVAHNYYYNCTVADVQNATGVGANNADVTSNDGAVSIHTLTLISGTTTSTNPTVTYNETGYFKSGQTVTVTVSESAFVGSNGNPITVTPYAAVTNNGDGTYSFTMPAADVTVTAVTLTDIPEQRYRGVAIEPTITLKDGETTLVEGTDYQVVFTNNTAIASADGPTPPTATITGINGYQGTLTKTFTIADFPLQTPGSENSADNPWLVASEDDLEALASLVNSQTRRDGYYKQTTDITMTHEHTAIGNQSIGFIGTYDGDNNAIRNLVINKPNDKYQGLFGNANTHSIVKNIVLENCDITGGNYTGGIAGKLISGELTNCVVSGAIKVGEGLSANNHGGIVGFLDGTLRWCINSACVTGAGSKHGGICGETSNWNPTITDNLNTGVVEGTSYVGSIVGHNQIEDHFSLYSDNYHTSNTTGSEGRENSSTGVDIKDEYLVFEISAADGLTLTLPTPTYTWGDKHFFNRGTYVTIGLTVPEGKYFDRYTVSNGTISNPFIIDGSHQLTGQTGDVVISASLFDGQVNLATAASIADIAAQTYNGVAYRPLPVVTYGGRTLVKDVNYTVGYSEGCTNAGTYTVTVTGMGSYTGQLTKDYVISPFDISADGAVTITGVETEYNQTSYAIHPQPVVTCAATNNATLVAGTDYDLTYSEGCTLPGNYNVILTGKDNYTGIRNVPFTILDGFVDLYVDGNMYTINTTQGWKEFCNLLDGGESFSGKTVKLGQDIEVTRCAGSGTGGNLTESDRPFCGTFDGGGKTLTFNYGSSSTPADENNLAPFRYVNNATIQHLHVAGDIYTQHAHTAGIVGQAYGTTNITDCRSSVNIHSSINGDGTHGGIMSCSWTGSTTNITGCLFDGSIQSVGNNVTDQCGGFVGWKNATINVTNSLLTADLSTIGAATGEAYPSATFVRHGNANDITNSYYVTALGTAQGKQARTITAGENVIVAFSGTANEYTTSGITAYKDGNTQLPGLKYGDVYYAGSSDAVSLTLNHSEAPTGYTFTGYAASNGGTITGNDNPYTLTMPDADVTVSAATPNTYYVHFEGNGNTGGSMSDQTFTYDEAQLLTANSFIRMCYSFNGWNTQADGNGDSYTDEQSVSNLTASNGETVTLYAQWTFIPIPYIDQNGVEQQCTDYTPIADVPQNDDESRTLTAGQWYVVNTNFSISDYKCLNINGSGAANIILCDGKNLQYYTADEGYINGSLNIYGQSAGTGVFYCYSNSYSYSRQWKVMEGNLTVYGGYITITGNDAGWECENQVGVMGNVTMYGGSLDVQGGNDYYLPGGSGSYGINGNVTMYGGTLNVRGGDVTGDQDAYAGCGISGDVTMYGGTLNARGGDCYSNYYEGFGIFGNVTMHGGTLTAQGGTKSEGIFGSWLHFYGGSLTAQGGSGNDDEEVADGIYANVTLDWTSATDRFYANSIDINHTVTIAQGKAFTDGTNIYSGTYTGDQKNALAGKTLSPAILLANDADNSTAIAQTATLCEGGEQIAVALQGRTFYKDGAWNTLCLPFALGKASAEAGHHFDGTPLEGATLMELDATGSYSGKQTGFNPDDGTLYLYFKDATTIEAGKPYIVKWDATTPDYIENPVFSGVTVSTDAPTGVTLTDGKYIVSAENSGLNTVQFIGSYSPVVLTLGDKSNLFLGTSTEGGYTLSTLYYPDDSNNGDGYYHINAFRAYFHVDLTGAANVRAFVLNFGGDEESQGITTTDYTDYTDSDGAWYDLNGRKLDGEPTAKGLYLHGGKKVVIK